CRQAKLVIEIDGGQHADSQRDQRRDEWLQQQGWTVFRVWNSDVRENPSGAAEAILARAAECLGGPTPNPSLPGRGDPGGRSLNPNLQFANRALRPSAAACRAGSRRSARRPIRTPI